jgi:RNA polymerase sigma-70 factor (ECF subfamily)
MAPAAFAQLSDEELFDKVLRGRVEREEDRAALGELCERWRKPACFVIRRIQASYKAGSPDDEPELFQEAVRKFIARGLSQYRGVSEQLPGKSASPKTFFLRIVKHVAIDHYRRRREELASPPDSEDAPETSVHEAQVSMAEARRSAERADATELYWAAFKRLQVEHPNEAAAWDLYHHQAVEDHEQCARQLMITVANSYKRVSRAQAYMKVYLLELMDEGGTS